MAASPSAPRLAANGAHMPAIGLGTSQLRGANCVQAVTAGFEVGYRHVDTAVMYGNETEVGEAIAAARLPRNEIFVTTKVLAGDIGEGNLQRSAQASLGRLKLDHVDLLLIHWPNASIPLAVSIAALCDAKRRGYAKAIGVANFPSAMLEEAVRLAADKGEKIAANQCEYHPRLDQTKLLAACRAHGVAFVSYCPLGRGDMIDDPGIAAIAKRIGRSPAQLVMRWHMQQAGVAAIPRSSQRAHLQENLAVFDFELTDADMQAIFALRRPNSRLISPPSAPAWDAA